MVALQRVLLINPTPFTTSMPSFGLGYISSYLRREGYITKVIECGNLSKSEGYERIRSFHSDVVGIGVWCRGFRHAKNCAQFFAKQYPEVIRVAGGPLASFIPDELLKEACFHYVIAGPGEIAMTRLLASLNEGITLSPDNDIQGVYYPGHNKRREFGEQIGDMDSLPFPDRDLDGRFIVPNTVMVNRGCDHHCIFCANPTMTRLKMRSISVVLEELEQMLSCSNSHDSSPPHVLFVDDNLAVSIPQVRELCMGIKSMLRRCTWSGHVRADVDCETLNDMKEAGCTYLGIGAESGNQRVLDQLGKGITLQQLEKVVAHARSLDVIVKLSYMIGHFCDTPATMDDTIEHARRMNQMYGARVALSCNTLFPGTPQYNRREELGLTIHASSWDEYDINSPTISGKHFRLEDLHEKRFQFAQAIHA